MWGRASIYELPVIFMDIHQTHFKDWFDKTINNQLEIRQELVGQSITEIFYTSQVDGWDIHIKDETVVHLPLGYLTFVTSKGHIYEFATVHFFFRLCLKKSD